MASITCLTALEAASSGYTHKITVKAADVAALTSATAYSLFPAFNSSSTDANLLVKDAAVYVETAFNAFQSDGTTAVTLVITVGDGSTANAYVASTTIKTAGWIKGAQTTNLIPASDIIKFTPTFGASGDPTKTTAGEMHIFLQLVDGANLAK